MPDPVRSQDSCAAALGVLRELRRIDDMTGVRHSGIARDIGLLLFESGPEGLSVNQIAAATGYSGPTIRLVLERLDEAAAIALGERRGKTQFYRLSARGQAGFQAYVEALLGFAAGLSGEADRGRRQDPPSDPPPPPGRYAGAPPARAAAE